jgi:hypothetical protein
MEELERLQAALWAHQNREAELRRALESTVPLLLHVCSADPCRRCHALQAAREALAT